MNTVVYCRVSSKEQIEGTSLESQEAACREYARSNKLRVLEVFVEQGESAKFADRTKLVELIDYCRKNKGQVQVLLVWKIDRFARNVADHFSVKATLGKCGVRIESVTEPIDAKPEGKLMETILAGFAQFDNDIRAMRTVQGMRRRVQEGIFPWRPPFGYKSSVTAAEKKTRPDLPDPATFALMQKAWKTFATGAYTQAEMGRLMRTWGLMTSAGRPFSPQTLSDLFRNPYYVGIIRDPWSGDDHEGQHAAMVTREEFTRVQQVIAAHNRRISYRRDNPEFPLRGVVRCNSCLHYLTGAFSRGRSRRYPYYVCFSPSCPKRRMSYPVEDIQNEFDGLLDRLAPRPDKVLKLGDHIAEAAERKQEQGAVHRQHRRKQIAQLEREGEELIRMRAQNLISDQEYMNQKRRILDQRIAWEAQDERRLSVEKVRQQIQEIMHPLTELRETWHVLRPPLRRRFDHMLLPVGFVIGQIRTAQTGLLFSTIGAFGRRDSGEVALTFETSNRIIEEIQAFWSILKGIEEPESEAKQRFKHRPVNTPRR